jgi:glycosyltransferase involved in cell wall biosynthesis
MAAISVLIMTLNEETNLAACLDSCAWSDDVVVYDSCSVDRTREIAAEKGARVFERRFDDYAGQRTAALTEVSFRHPWVLMVDADERTPSDLVAEMAGAVEGAPPDTVLFRMRRKDMFLGRWLRRSSGYPTWFGRLIRIGRVRIERAINEEYIADGAVNHLRSHLIHYPFNKGISYWFERHNRYSTLEAVAKIRGRSDPIALRRLLSADPVERRRTLKQIAYRLPLRPSLVFCYWYFVRLGFLDGRAGYVYSRLRASYELLIDLKVLEQERLRRGAPV